MLDAFPWTRSSPFLAAAEEGSFSAAGRRLGRSQSVVSQTWRTSKTQLGVAPIRSRCALSRAHQGRRGPAGRARTITQQVGTLKAKARAIGGGLEAELAVAVDVMFPIHVFARAVRDFPPSSPETPLRVEVESLAPCLQPVFDGRCSFAVASFLPEVPPNSSRNTCSPSGSLLSSRPATRCRVSLRAVPRDVLAEHVQLVLDRSIT